MASATDFADYSKVLLVELDGAPGIAKVSVGQAQVAEMDSFCYRVFPLPGGGEGEFSPANLVPGGRRSKRRKVPASG